MIVLPFRFLRQIPFQNRNFIRCCSLQKIYYFNLPHSCLLTLKQRLPLKIAAIHTSQCHMKTVSFLLADIGEGIQDVVIKEWYVKEGDKVNQFDNVCEVQSDKASVTITSRYDGIVQKIYHGVDETAFVGKPLMDVEVEKEVSGIVGAEVQEGEAIAVGTPEEDNGSRSIELPKSSHKVLTTPAVRRVAMENKVDLTQVTGSGKDGRVLKEDVIDYVENLNKPIEKRTKVESKMTSINITQPRMTTIPHPVTVKQDVIVPIKGYIKTMVRTMVATLKIPSFTYCDEVDMTNLINLKKDMKSVFEQHQLKFSYMPFFLKAASIALHSYPILNSSLDENCENIIYKSSHNIGYAMDTSVGLAVPNIKNVQSLSILQISEEMGRLQECGKTGTFSTHDLTGGTLTISNIGSIGGTYTKPIILSPEVAIVGLGKIQCLPRFNSSGAVVETHIMNISWCADHRIIDGATIARFSNIWKNCLENPSHMLLNMK